MTLGSGPGADTTATASGEGVPEKPVTFFALAAPVRGRIVAAGVMSALGALAGLLPIVFAYELARTLLPTLGGTLTEGRRAFVIVGWLVLSVVLAQLLNMGGLTVSHIADARFADYLRQRQITQSLRLRLDWFAREGSGRVKTVVQDDVAKVHQLIAHVIPDTVNGIVRPLASLIMLFAWDWRIGLVGMVPLLFAVGSLPLMLKDFGGRSERYNRALADLNADVVEFVQGIAPIKVFEASAKGPKKFRASTVAHHQAYSDWMEHTVHGSALLMAFTSPGFALTSATLGTGLLVVFAGLDPLLLVPSVLLAANIADPLYMLAQMRQFVRQASESAQNIAGFFALPAAPPGDPAVQTVGEACEITDVSFTYAGGTVALDRVSAMLAQGAVTALVGPSGSGKSTLASLVPRLLDPDAGELRIGGADTSRLTPEHLYRKVGFVFQRPFLLRMSIRDNIRLSRPNASDAEVVAAARAAQIHERIERLPERYDSVVGEGARLSGGEEQRISIARALLLDAPFLVLDEATAFADPDAEAMIQRGLAELTRGRTLLVVAHRLHTVKEADKILVLANGKIVEAGTHDELIAAGALYARMWRTYQDAREHGLRDGRPVAVPSHPSTHSLESGT